MRIVSCIDFFNLFRKTDSDGRCMQLWPKATAEHNAEQRAKLKAGALYKVVFKTKVYFESTGRKCFYPWVEVSYVIAPESSETDD